MLVFIGTLHNNFTPKDELIEIIESFHPSQLLVEITQQNLDTNNTDKYPPEMQAVFAWAIKNLVKIHGIDSTIMTLKDNVSEKDLEKLDDEQVKIIHQHDWKDFNKHEFFDALRTKTWYEVIDAVKDTERNLEIATNIK